MNPRVLLLVAGLGLAASARTAAAQQVEARLDRSRIGLGETTALRVTVRGSGNARTPEFEVPEGLQVLSSGRQQSFSWVNGRASNETEFRFEILAQAVGRFAIGPIQVAVGSQVQRAGPVTLEVLEAPPTVPGGDARASGAVPATLRVDVDPRSPYVGEEMTLRVRLIQRAAFAEDPEYIPPTTTGFWTDRFSAPESYYAEVGRERVLVTETRTRLFPLAIGNATIGEAAASVVLAGASSDPFGWLQGDRRRMMIRSQPVTVRVRPLPGGAPAGFTGGVGAFEVRWSADRARTARDVPVTVRLDVRGRGNLPMLRPPAFQPAGFEVFASTVDDSAAPDAAGIGRKRFQWTLLPAREGEVTIAPPTFAWFDPGAGRYRSAALAAVALEVGPALLAGGAGEQGFPRAIADHPATPGGHGPRPWAYALAGLALGSAVTLWRRRRPASAEDEAAIREWSKRVGAQRGEEFWHVAEDAIRWLEAHGKVADSPGWRDIRTRVSASRYGGGAGDPEAVRRAVLGRLERALPARGDGGLRRTGALALALAALALVVGFGPRPSDPRYARLALEADGWARRGDIGRAREAWLALWREGGDDAGLAARLAWESVQGGEVGRAALWVLRGNRVGARDPALHWVAERVREAGGLMGAGMMRLPVRDLEWSVLALLLGGAAPWLRRRRWWSLACGLLALGVAGIGPLERAWIRASGQAVVLQPARVEGTDIDLDPGQVVRVQRREGERVRVKIGRMTDGWLPATSVGQVAEERDGRG